MKISDRIYYSSLSILSDNQAGLSFDELYHRLNREYKTLNRRYLTTIVGKMFRNNKIQSYTLDGTKLLQMK